MFSVAGVLASPPTPWPQCASRVNEVEANRSCSRWYGRVWQISCWYGCSSIHSCNGLRSLMRGRRMQLPTDHPYRSYCHPAGLATPEALHEPGSRSGPSAELVGGCTAGRRRSVGNVPCAGKRMVRPRRRGHLPRASQQ